ncbi:MAG TPA: hypothetical protein VHE59_06630 [Mucilaginibacter sp.]|nr:hypothetical protein [Mucilaginibacter sp.]
MTNTTLNIFLGISLFIVSISAFANEIGKITWFKWIKTLSAKIILISVGVLIGVISSIKKDGISSEESKRFQNDLKKRDSLSSNILKKRDSISNSEIKKRDSDFIHQVKGSNDSIAKLASKLTDAQNVINSLQHQTIKRLSDQTVHY